MTEDWTEDQRAGDTSDTETQRRNSVPGQQPSLARRQETVTPARRERGSVASVAGPGPGPVTHMRRGQLSAFWEQSWFSGKANGVIGNKGNFVRF